MKLVTHIKIFKKRFVGITAVSIFLSIVMPIGINAQGNVTAKEKPNIILFLVDDMGWQDTSLPFYKESTANNKKYHTPNMERLAAMGVKFTNAYANAVCTPTRVSLMTGMSEARHKVTNWSNALPDAPTDGKYPGLTWPDWNYNGLSPIKGIKNTVVATALPKLLNENGYFTIHVGKAHFASYASPAADPQNIGFSVNIAGDTKGSPGSYLGLDNYGNDEEGQYTFSKGNRGLEEYHGKDVFLTEALTIEAKKAMDKALSLKHPFFLYMSHYAVHGPFKEDKRFIQKYKDSGLSQKDAEYAALIEGMDKSLGDLMDFVKDRNIAKNTIILFMSDNGGVTQQRLGFNDNAPLRSGKGSVFEGGIREPMIAYWPGVTKAGTVNSQYLGIQDFMPSILEMAGVKDYKTIQKIDGISFVPYLKDNTIIDDNKVLVWHSPTTWQQGEKTVNGKVKTTTVDEQGYGPTTAIRKGNWKLIYFYGLDQSELYQLDTDISEKKNVIKQYPEKAKELMGLMIENLKESNAQYPIKTVSGKEIYPNLN